jgi:hypothetical protein
MYSCFVVLGHYVLSFLGYWVKLFLGYHVAPILGFAAMRYLGYCVAAYSPGRFSTFVPVSRRKTDPATKTHPHDLRGFYASAIPSALAYEAQADGIEGSGWSQKYISIMNITWDPNKDTI